jgi:ABC-type bacteriocin/lantibiotic exporter with double-glycine peptidase domain
VDCRNKTVSSSYDEVIEEPKETAVLGESGFLSSTSSSSKSSKTTIALPFDVVTVQDGAFGWDTEQPPTLQDITLRIPRSSFTMLIGTSGCGKSTLLKALLGEVPCLSGKVTLPSKSIAYCDQTPWHMNGTIQESIIAMSGLDESWYASVIRACALEEDLEQLPRGDMTVIGSKGIALSGGQSQRIVCIPLYGHFGIWLNYVCYRHLQGLYTPGAMLLSWTTS